MALLGAVFVVGGTFGHLYSEGWEKSSRFIAFEVGDGTRFSF